MASNIIASIFNAANLSPTYVVGGQVLSVGRSSNLGEGNYIIVEADESDGSFLHLQPEIAVITNIDNDHLSFYEYSQDKLNQSFISFAENLPFYGHILLNLDDINIRKISEYWKNRFFFRSNIRKYKKIIRITRILFENLSSASEVNADLVLLPCRLLFVV